MTPPRTKGNGTSCAEMPQESPAVLLCPDLVANNPSDCAAIPAARTTQDGPIPIQTLKKRPDFLRAASARRQGTGGFLVQARDRADGHILIRVGYTASKKIGNAVMRNRAKRRLRALVQAVLPKLALELGLAGWDYVLVAKPGVTPDRPFDLLIQDLDRALRQIHRLPEVKT